MTHSYDDKAFFWLTITLLLATPHAVLLPLQFAVDGMPWDAVIASFSLLFPVLQAAALVRMCVCFHHARRESDGAS